jgi:hypothetical protein
MAGVIQGTSEIHRPRKLYSEVLKERRRYEHNEAVTVSEGIVGEPTVAWDYRVIKGKWDVPEDAKRFRKCDAIRSWNERSLRKVLNHKRDKNAELSEEVQAAVSKLRQLQLTETETPEATKGIVKTAREKSPKNQKKSTNEDQPKETVTLQQLWNEFVLATRVKSGWYEKLPKKGCYCGKARISYPHWPPTSEEESMEQFSYCMNDYNDHRRNLVMRWWEHFNEFANMLTWNVSERQSYYQEAAEMIRLHSRIVQRELERSLTHKRRPKGWSCEEYCDKVLTKKQVSCLCHCGEHRDCCPIHSY